MHEVTACLEILRESAHVLSGGLEEAQVIQALLTQSMAVVDGHGAVVRLLSPDGDQLLLAGAQGLSDAYLDKGPIRVATSPVDQRALAGEVVVVPDIKPGTGMPYPVEAEAEGLRGVVVIPLRVREHSIGVLQVFVDRPEQLGPGEEEVVSILADLGAVVLEKVRLHKSLYSIAAALNTSLELQPLLHEVLETTVREMWLKAASIRLLDARGQTLKLVAAHGLSDDYLDKGEVHVAKSPTDQHALQGETVVLYDVGEEVGFEYPQEAVREGIRSVLVVSLKLKDRPLGVLRVYSAQPRHFGPVAITFLSSVADLVALAIENAGLYAALEDKYENLKLDLAEWYRFLALG
jgi:GAF domain-containing protein